MRLLLLLQREEPVNWLNWALFALFVVFPLLARVLRALALRLGLLRPEVEVVDEEDPSVQRRRLREERRQAEAEGEDLWRRLARGEEVAPPSARPVLVPPPVAREVSLELEVEPEPLSVLGPVLEPSEAPEVSLERAEEPAPLAALAAPPEEAAAEPRRPRFTLVGGDLRRGIVLAEILGRPVSERGLAP